MRERFGLAGGKGAGESGAGGTRICLTREPDLALPGRSATVEVVFEERRRWRVFTSLLAGFERVWVLVSI